MERVLDQPTADADNHLRAYTADEDRELALLMQFMCCDSVASLANAIAERLGGCVQAGDLIAAADLGVNHSGCCSSSDASLVNPGAALRR